MLKSGMRQILPAFDSSRMAKEYYAKLYKF